MLGSTELTRYLRFVLWVVLLLSSYYDDMAVFDGLLSKGELELANAAAEKIFDSYLSQTADSPINIPDTTRQRILTSFEQNRSCTLDSLLQKSTLLNEARREVLVLMEKDNFARFKVSTNGAGTWDREMPPANLCFAFFMHAQQTTAFELMLKEVNTKLPSEPFEERQAITSFEV